MNNVKRYLVYNGQVRAIAIDATQLVQDIRDTHNLTNLTTAALGRTMIVASMIASTLKNDDDRLTVQIKGDGDIGNVIVCANKQLELKGYVTNPQVSLPLNNEGKIDVSGGIGKGTLTVIKDIGLKEPYIGTCELLTGEIGDDFAYYFNVSEQTPSVVAVGVLIGKNQKVQRAGGYIIQPMPDCDEEIIDRLESINLRLPHMTTLMEEGRTLDDIIINATGDEKVECVFSSKSIVKCDCSKERIEKTIIALGKKEVMNIFDSIGKFEVSCDFCNKKYEFSKEELKSIFEIGEKE